MNVLSVKHQVIQIKHGATTTAFLTRVPATRRAAAAGQRAPRRAGRGTGRPGRGAEALCVQALLRPPRWPQTPVPHALPSGTAQHPVLRARPSGAHRPWSCARSRLYHELAKIVQTRISFTADIS